MAKLHKVGDSVRCALPGCEVVFKIEDRRQLRKKYHSRKCKFQHWFNRNYKKVSNGNPS